MCACVAAYGVYLGLPLILGALADEYGFGNPQIGWIGAAENAGMLLGSVSVSVLGRWTSYRALTALGIAIALAGNGITLGSTSFTAFCTVRLLTGIGSGICYSAAIAALSLTRQSARNFSIFVVVLVIANSLELWLIPAVVAAWHARGIYAVLDLLFLPPALLIGYIPKGLAYAPDEAPPVAARAMPLAVLCLLGVVLFCVAASAFYAYAERIGLSVGMTESSIANTLTLCNLFSLTGSMLAYALGRRWGQHRPQMAAILVMISVYAMWSISLSVPAYICGVLIFFEVWSMASVYQLSTLTGIDPSGRYVALIPAAQGIGQSAGPFLAGTLLAQQLGFAQMLGVVALFAIGSLVSYSGVYLRLRRSDPVAAGV
ncbi:MAG TPA: MFS transporter [Steroidobacteraceae bacterium]|nr:MFS transporter [Steroidobacteraceae bacterium]